MNTNDKEDYVWRITGHLFIATGMFTTASVLAYLIWSLPPRLNPIPALIVGAMSVAPFAGIGIYALKEIAAICHEDPEWKDHLYSGLALYGIGLLGILIIVLAVEKLGILGG